MPWSKAELEDAATNLFADDMLPLDDAIVEALSSLSLAAVEEFFVSGGVMPNPPEPFAAPSVSLTEDVAAIAAAMQKAGKIGLLEITDVPTVPLTALQATFDDLHSRSGQSLAPFHPRSLKLKDAYAKEKRGAKNDSGSSAKHSGSSAKDSGSSAKPDMKRILDLNPKTLAEAEAALQLENSCSGDACAGDACVDVPCADFKAVVNFWRECADSVAPKLRSAVAIAAGSDAILSDTHFDFRMVDYYTRALEEAPRCRAHRDFGSFTLVFASSPGLQALLDGSGANPHASGDPGEEEANWRDVAPSAPGAALLLFGWCTQIRSNGRLHAAQHRVVDHATTPPARLPADVPADFAANAADAADATAHDVTDDAGTVRGRSPRRTSAVFFVSPDDMQAPLQPAVLAGESANYVDGVSAEAQMMYNLSHPMARAKGPR